MTGENIEQAVTIDIYHGDGLGEDGGTVESGRRVAGACGIGPVMFQPVIVAADQDIRVAIVVGIPHTDGPLPGGRSATNVQRREGCSAGPLVFKAELQPVLQMQDIIHTITVHIGHPNGHAAIGSGGGEAAGAIEKGNRIESSGGENPDGDRGTGRPALPIEHGVEEGGGAGKAGGWRVAVLVAGERGHHAGGRNRGDTNGELVVIGIRVIGEDADDDRSIQGGASLVVEGDRAAVDRRGGLDGQGVDPSGQGGDGGAVHGIAPDGWHLMQAVDAQTAEHDTIARGLRGNNAGIDNAEVVENCAIHDVLLGEGSGQTGVKPSGLVGRISWIVTVGAVGVQIGEHPVFEGGGGVRDRD